MEDKNLPGTKKQTFSIILDKEWLKGNYILGCDPYEEERPLNFYNKIRRFLGFKYKNREIKSKVLVYKIYSDGTVENI